MFQYYARGNGQERQALSLIFSFADMQWFQLLVALHSFSCFPECDQVIFSSSLKREKKVEPNLLIRKWDKTKKLMCNKYARKSAVQMDESRRRNAQL